MNILLIFFIVPLVSSSTNCSIFLSLNCSCFQSNIDLNYSLPIRTYSHLVCQGNSLNEKTFQAPFGSDFSLQNSFRTVSLEFTNENHLEIYSNQFDSLAILFSQTNSDVEIEIFLRFNGFSQITFHEYSLTSRIFQEKHENKRLWIHLIPGRKNLTDLENQFYFLPNCFSHLNLSQLTIYIYTRQDRFPSLSSFDEIFNHTNLGELHIHGSIIPPNSSLQNQTFQGQIKSLSLHRYVDTIDSNSFPFYPHVYSYTIHSIEAHSMNLSSFLPSYTNLRGLEIIKPKFDVLINHFIPTLDSITLNIEHITEKTLLAARHIRHLKLGSRLRTINPQVLMTLSRRLYQLDLSTIDLSQMTIDSRCHLLTYLSNHSQLQINILYPRFENSTECNCDRLFIDHIQSYLKVEQIIDSTCSKLCTFSDCQVVSEYFKEKYPLMMNEEELIHILNETIHEKNITDEHFSAVDLFDDAVDVDMMSFLMNQTSEQERNKTQRRSSSTTTTTISTFLDMNNISAIEDIQEYDDIISFSTPKIFESSKNPNSIYRYPSFSWLSFFIGVGLVFLLFISVSLVIFFIVLFRKKHNFKPVPVYV
ncbi:hypothetical protein I4U23_026961 [Adineta vaga]|nr:hypothetical protein I4U23_026961 [Adineta vaga]